MGWERRGGTAKGDGKEKLVPCVQFERHPKNINTCENGRSFLILNNVSHLVIRISVYKLLQSKIILSGH